MMSDPGGAKRGDDVRPRPDHLTLRVSKQVGRRDLLAWYNGTKKTKGRPGRRDWNWDKRKRSASVIFLG